MVCESFSIASHLFTTNHTGAAFFLNSSGELLILLCDAIERIDHQQHDIRALLIALKARLIPKNSGPKFYVLLFTDARRIDQSVANF